MTSAQMSSDIPEECTLPYRLFHKYIHVLLLSLRARQAASVIDFGMVGRDSGAKDSAC